MNFNEPTASLRRIPVYLIDSSGTAVTGATPTGAQIKVSKSGASFVNGAGTWTEVGSGNYYYTATQAETATDSYLFLLVSATGAVVFPYALDIGQRIVVGETLPAARRIPIFLKDTSGIGVTGVVLTGSEVQVSLDGAVFVDGTGTSGETGSGAYYYQAASAEVGTLGYVVLKVIDAAAVPYVYTFDVIPADAISAGDGCYFGSYFGGPGSSTTTTTTPAGPSPVPSPYLPSSPAYFDHVASALNRLPEQYRGD